MRQELPPSGTRIPGLCPGGYAIVPLGLIPARSAAAFIEGWGPNTLRGFGPRLASYGLGAVYPSARERQKLCGNNHLAANVGRRHAAGEYLRFGRRIAQRRSNPARVDVQNDQAARRSSHLEDLCLNRRS